MLIQLAISNIVLVEQLKLEFSPGFTILTGETGAGKSILLDAFTLALGGRGDGSLVRSGAAQGQVCAVFDLCPTHPARAALRDQGIDSDGEVIFRRVQLADGRTRAFINDQPVSAQNLRSIGRLLLEIHGQHDDRALMDIASHRMLLDAYGGLEPQAAAVRHAHHVLKEAEQACVHEDKRLTAVRVEADYLAHAHAELSKLGVEAGEDERLASRRQSMMQAEKVSADLRDAFQCVHGDGSPVAALTSAIRRLDRRQSLAPTLIDPCLASLGAALDALETARTVLDDALERTDFNPHELEKIEERLFSLRGAARKYQTHVADLPALAERMARQLDDLVTGEARLGALRAAAEAARATYEDCANILSERRRKAALEFSAAVMTELGPLKLERAHFATRVTSDREWAGDEGWDRVEFWVETNPGARPGPLMKVASGGELARFLLALKVVLADRGSAPTLVFDEIDTGVGGAVAAAIGHRLERLADRVQVLAVTHAPQVAARACAHFRIEKTLEMHGERMATQVSFLQKDERREEIARMLAGAIITEEARAAAERLLEQDAQRLPVVKTNADRRRIKRAPKA